MNNKQITSKPRLLKIQQWLVLSILLFILLPAIFVLTTDGLIKNVILNNFALPVTRRAGWSPSQLGE